MLYRKYVKYPDGKYYLSKYDSKKYTEKDLIDMGVVDGYFRNKEYKFVEVEKVMKDERIQC